LIGLIYEICELFVELYPCIKKRQSRRVGDVEGTPSEAFSEPDNTTANTSLTYKKKAGSIFKEYILHSIGELLLLPSLVCSLYGIINEKGWTFENAIAGFTFVVFLYSIAVDTFYGKFYLIWLLQKVIITNMITYEMMKRLLARKQNFADAYLLFT